ncbi:MAG: Crp/Fnr family transcriptional regulator [Arcicella sp.]|jgi:CRP-like cAMP-binding protein|nr:Crp/Fnr family transcriptional regulator [Arcicella sp.]
MLTEILAQIGRFSDNDVSLFEKKIKTRTVQKGEILLHEGGMCQTVFYAITGSFYQFNLKDEIEENIIDLHIEKDWFLSVQSFIAQKPSENTIKAYSDGTVLELSIESIHQLIAESPAFFQLGHILEQSKPKLYFFEKNLTPVQKYLYILETKPTLFQKFPLKIIASYLKITPETMSRVRESIAKGKFIS